MSIKKKVANIIVFYNIPNFGVVTLPNFNYFSGCIMFHCVFNFQSLITNDVENVTQHLSDSCVFFCKISVYNFFPFLLDYLFIFIVVTCVVERFYILMKSNLSFAVFIIYLCGLSSKTDLCSPVSCELLLLSLFPCKTFIVFLLPCLGLRFMG